MNNKYQLTEDQLDAWNGIKEFAKARIAPYAKQIDSDGVFPAEIFGYSESKVESRLNAPESIKLNNVEMSVP